MKFVLTIVFFLSQLVFASPPEKSTGDKTNKKTKLSDTVTFEDLLVQGKHHFSDEAVVTVEQDKVLDALLGIRKDFKDRVKKATSRK